LYPRLVREEGMSYGAASCIRPQLEIGARRCSMRFRGGRLGDLHRSGGWHRAAAGLPRRPAEGADQVRAYLEVRGAHRAPGLDGPGWAISPAVLRRVRDALAAGRQQ
jgi:hypothetical protein